MIMMGLVLEAYNSVRCFTMLGVKVLLMRYNKLQNRSKYLLRFIYEQAVICYFVSLVNSRLESTYVYLRLFFHTK